MLFESVRVQVHFLPNDVRAEDVARRTRHAAHAFLTGAAHGWGRTKLRSWLIVEYAMAIEWTREDEVSPWPHRDARMDDEHVREVVEDARRRVTRLIVDEASGWQAPGFAAEMIHRGLITSVTDSSGGHAYAPAARVEMSLLERVAALFIADFLAHPADYTHVASREGCGEIQLFGRLHARACVKLLVGLRPSPSGGPLRASLPGMRAGRRESPSRTALRAADAPGLTCAAPMRRSG